MSVSSIVYFGLAGFSLFVLIVLGIVSGVAGYQIDRDINSWKARARGSAVPKDIHDYMNNVKSGLERRGMNVGNTALFFPTSKSDMNYIYRSVCGIADQAEILMNLDHSSPSYQSGMDNLHDTLGNLELYTKEFWDNHGVGLLCNVFIWISTICFCILAFAGCVGMIIR